MIESYTQIHKSNYYTEYKRVRNQLRKYHPSGVLLAGIYYLNQPAENEFEQLQKLPWMVLLVIKWAFVDEEYSYSNKKDITNYQFKKILQLAYDLGNKVRMPNQYSNAHLFIRNIAYQQFLYQQNLNINKFGRQLDLFVKNGHFFNDIFFSRTGLHIDRFLELSFAVLARFLLQNEKSVNVSWFKTIFSEYSQEEVEKFLFSISINVESIHGELNKSGKSKRESYEYYEQTPFAKFPLINIRGIFWCISPMILCRCIENYIYDNLRSWNASKFMDKFGKVFENYVYKSLCYSEIEVTTERQLQNHFGVKNKLVDFIISENNSNIFIDAKAVEMSYQGKVAQVSEIIKDKTKHTIIKAIEQAHETNFQIFNKQNTANNFLNSCANNYLLVITFKELYLGNGTTFYECIAQDNLNRIHNRFPEQIRIPFENMYFITIDELDLLLEAIKNKKVTIVEAIEKAKVADSEPRTKKFDFMLHLKSWGAEQYPKFLEDSWKNVIFPIAKALK